jgi:G3E family GTPase
MNTQVVVKALNDTAVVRTAEYGKLEVNEILGIQPEARTDASMAATNLQMSDSEKLTASADETVEPVKACCAAKTCSSTNDKSTAACESTSTPKRSESRAETRFGIVSFVYCTERLMSRVKLMKVLGDWQKAREQFGNTLNLSGLGNDSSQATINAEQAGSKRSVTGSPLGPILRSKGMLFLDVNPKAAFYWSHAGKAVNFSVFGPWTENVPHIGNATGAGARRTELVFIGAGYDEASIRDLLDSCLLSDADLKFFKESFGQSQSHSHTH